MTNTPPTSPPATATTHRDRSNSRMSIAASSKLGAGSGASDDLGKTSVKVAVRIRPPLKPSDPGYDLVPQRFQKSMVHNATPTNISVDSPQGRKVFVFDRVFGEEVQQDGVYEYISSSVDAFLQGYNVSIMAYGQSGAGKSFTMGTSGPQEQNDKQHMGIIPRAASSLFAKLTSGAIHHVRDGSQLKTPNRYSMSFANGLSGKSSVERGWQLKATYVEIYNEQLRDLLIPEGTPFEQRPIPAIREDKGRILLTNLTQLDINSVEDLLDALNYGSSVRQTDATAINARSSRSHAIFSLNLIQRKDDAQELNKRYSMPVDALSAEQFVTTDSKLHFVDLAGSERLKNTQASGERAKEGISINAGLASLGKVISQLSSRQPGSHVSYRDSKLTRILQDSLGGNAITYLVACVTPAEFHLSETLNTVQYAQRARAIQSKPQIQQLSDEGDKQAVIDRLRVEISFLRDQIKMSHQANASAGPVERTERQGEREAELQEHLLDVQESYSALSKRHARLVSEISRAGQFAEASALAAGEDPAERIRRSESFDKAIEQMVTEYETTIQSLETSLSSTRSQLTGSESKLQEHETKISYIETVNQQLTTRLDKIMNRETSLESYTRDLEARLDGRESSDDRNSAVVADLRKELNRLREAEATSEDYISNLEERLAEAESDMELMNREINRLEHVVDRQRSVGKLDTLLHDLDKLQSKRSAETNGERGVPADNEQPLNGSAEHDLTAPQEVAIGPSNSSPTQMQFVEEKLDAVNQELVSLRVEHDATVNEYDMLAAKYEEALRTLAAMQDASEHEQDQDKASPAAFLADARVREVKNEGGQQLSSRSLSSELSSAGVSPVTGNEESFHGTDFAEADGQPRSTPGTSVSSSLVRPLSDLSATGAHNRTSQPSIAIQTAIARELESLKAASLYKDERVEELSHELEEVKVEHDKTLEVIANLKADLQRAKAGTPNSPTAGHHFVRRKSGQVLSSDRTNRAFVSLGNIASDHFEELPDVRENFTIQLNALSSEMQNRNERVETLETELSNAKKEMEAKMQIISGLARERSSMKTASPVDISVVSSMREQLARNETHIKALQDQLGSRESELGKEIRALKAALQESQEKSGGTIEIQDRETSAEENIELVTLREQLSEVENRHKQELVGLKTAESQMMEAIAELEATLSSVDSARQQHATDAENHKRSADAATAALEIERQKLSEELEQQKATIAAHAGRYADLQLAYEALGQELEQHSGFNEATVGQLENHRTQISMLEQHLQSQYDAIERYKETIKEMAENHAKELDHLQTMLAPGESDEQDADAPADVHQRLRAAEDSRADAEGSLAALQAKIQALSKLEDQLKTENNQLRERELRASRLVEGYEGQVTHLYEDNRQTTSRLSEIQQNHEKELADARAAAAKAEQEKNEVSLRLLQLERSGTPNRQEFSDRTNSMASRRSMGLAGLPSPPPAMPLPPLPANMPQSPFAATFADSEGRPTSPPMATTKRDSATQARLEEQENRIKTIEKHLFAEKQLTATLEEALVDVESQSEKVKKEAETWRNKAVQVEQELATLKEERSAARHSVQQMEDERSRRLEAEQARARLEEKMAMINKKKKKGTLNCF